MSFFELKTFIWCCPNRSGHFWVSIVVTQLQNWAKMAVSLPILPILKLGSQFFGRCRFLRIGNLPLLLPKSIWAFFRVATPFIWCIFPLGLKNRLSFHDAEVYWKSVHFLLKIASISESEIFFHSKETSYIHN